VLRLSQGQVSRGSASPLASSSVPGLCTYVPGSDLAGLVSLVCLAQSPAEPGWAQGSNRARKPEKVGLEKEDVVPYNLGTGWNRGAQGATGAPRVLFPHTAAREVSSSQSPLLRGSSPLLLGTHSYFQGLSNSSPSFCNRGEQVKGEGKIL
jgi:hypothetical protein